ncbi:MAG: acetylserotonin O-methyltransferase [Syntrophobacteraceae bacterium]|jgi:SAM-dependent methyltransferase|nr:acetylserotonin O-methyltransferase [Syntrophobacteraceae bacterium]
MGKMDAIMGDARGFMKSRVILTASELDLFTQLEEEPGTAREVARARGLDPRAATRLLDCLVVLGFLRKDNGIYSPTESGAFYSSRHPESVLPMVLHLSRLWGTWSGLTELVREGGHRGREPGLQVEEWDWKSFIGAMHVVGRELSVTIAADYDLSRFQCLLDIGGASGTYTIAFLRRNPAMTAVLYDLENVMDMARERLAEEGLLEKVRLAVGDFYRDELPGGCDLALLSAIIHQNSPQENLDLYRKVFRALEPGGTLLIRDHIMDESRTHPPGGAMFAINMLVNTRGGDTYTFKEVEEGLLMAGFTEVRQVRHGMDMDCLVEGRKPLA